MARRHRSPLWHLILSAIMVAAAMVYVLYLSWQNRTLDPPPAPEPLPAMAPKKAKDERALAAALYEEVDETLEELGIWADLIHKVRGVEATAGAVAIDTIAVRIPADLPLAAVNLDLALLVQRRGGEVLRAVEYQRPARVEMRCGLENSLTTLFVLKRASRIRRKVGRIALVLDDFGSMSKHLTERFCALPQALTLAVLPNEGRVKTIVDLARRHGHEVLVHLPMEPEEYPQNNPGDNAIFAHQDSSAIRRLVRAALRKVPNAVGLNNHMGSRATTDPRVMELVLSEVKRNNLLFLDSRTTPSSVAYDMARAMAIPATRRDLFIDPVDQTAAVEARLWELAALAAEQGQAIGIGHDREQTLLALEAILPRLETRGFRFVPISALAQ